jgi:hypothetical protein
MPHYGEVQRFKGVLHWWDGAYWLGPYGHQLKCDACGGGYTPKHDDALNPCHPGKQMTAADPVTINEVQAMAISGERRIKYNDGQGHWEVVFNGKVIVKAFKTSAEAYQYMRDLVEGRKKPEDK